MLTVEELSAATPVSTLLLKKCLTPLTSAVVMTKVSFPRLPFSTRLAGSRRGPSSSNCKHATRRRDERPRLHSSSHQRFIDPPRKRCRRRSHRLCCPGEKKRPCVKIARSFEVPPPSVFRLLRSYFLLPPRGLARPRQTA